MSIQSLASSLQKKIRSDFPLSSLSDPNFNIDSFLSSCLSNKPKDILDTCNSLKRDLESFLGATEKSLSQHITQDFDHLLSIPSLMLTIDSDITSLHNSSISLQSSLQKFVSHSQKVSKSLSDTLQKQKERQVAEEKLRESHSMQKIFSEFDEKFSTLRKFSSFPLAEKALIPYGPLAERVASLVFNLSKVKHYKSAEIGKRRSEFLQFLQKEVAQISVDLESCSNFESLLVCYKTLGLETEVQMILRDSVVYPAVKSFVPDQSLILDDSFNIRQFYQSCTSELKTGKLQLFYLHRNLCDILIKAFWKGIWKVLLAKPKLFSPIFSHDYQNCLTESLQFLQALSKSSESGEDFCKSSEYSDFIDKWNLPTYFELKKTEIIKKILPLLKTDDLAGFCKLGAAGVFSEALKSCTASVLAPELGTKFLRLYFQITSTYCNFVTRKFNQQAKGKGNTKEDLTGVLKDLSDLKAFVDEEELNIEVKTEIQANFQQIIDPCVRTLVEILTKQCLVTVESLKAIPSMYRMTGRSAPIQASPAISQILQPIKGLEIELIPREKIVNKVILSFIDTSQEVKTEIIKVGELLNKYNPDSQDTEKMNKQLALDIEEFKNQLLFLGYTEDNNEIINHLR